MRALADECRHQGLKLFLYYSQLDWHPPDYFPRGETGNATDRPDHGAWSRYLDYMDAQLTELLTGYGPIGGIWFDGMWDKPDADWRLERTYGLVHRLRPDALVISNHHRAPIAGEDVQTFERVLPGGNTAGFNTTRIGTLPLETSETMNDSWGFRLTDRHWKEPGHLIRELAAAAGHDANFLFNVGPRPDGKLPGESLERRAAIGRWLQVNGSSIYGTRGGPVAPRNWGVATQRGHTVLVHLLSLADRVLALPPHPGRVRWARLLDGGDRVDARESPHGVIVTLPHRDEADPD